MKTTKQLNALIPEIADALANNHHDIGDLFPERNYFCFEKDGWYVEVEYSCIGDFTCRGDFMDPYSYSLIAASGSIDSIIVCHTDEETGEETEFSDEDVDELRRCLDMELSEVA